MQTLQVCMHPKMHSNDEELWSSFLPMNWTWLLRRLNGLDFLTPLKNPLSCTRHCCTGLSKDTTSRLLEAWHVVRWILLLCSLPYSEDRWQYLHGLTIFETPLSLSTFPLIRVFLAGWNHPVGKTRLSACTVDKFRWCWDFYWVTMLLYPLQNNSHNFKGFSKNYSIKGCISSVL